MSKFYFSKPFDGEENVLVPDIQNVIQFLNKNKEFGAVNYLGAFAEDIKISHSVGYKSKNKFLLVDRNTFSIESPGEQYEIKDSGADVSIFDFEYNLPDQFPSKPTKPENFVLLNTVKNNSCTPSQTCSRCKGGGRCRSCYGKGFTRCTSCGGRGIKREQIGTFDGKPKYQNSKCYSCWGDGQKDCWACSGTGVCSSCGSSGKVACSRCDGTGIFQTYTSYSTSFRTIEKEVDFCDYPDLLKAYPKTSNTIVFQDDLVEWENGSKILFDNRQNLLDINEKTLSFSKKLDDTLHKENSSRLGRVNTIMENVPVTKVNYIFEGRAFELFILGGNNIVCYNDVPKKHSYRLTFWQRLINFFTKRKRQLAFMYIAGYIFRSDAATQEQEKEFFEELIGNMKIGTSKKELVVSSLVRTHSLEEIKPYINCVKKDRRSLIFAWHCAMQGDDVSKEEEKAFDKLAAYFEVQEQEIATVKHKAKQFSALSAAQLMNEYFK